MKDFNNKRSVSSIRETTIKKDMDDFYQFASSQNLEFWGEADTDMKFEAGDQGTINSLHPDIPIKQNRMFYFNKIRRIVNLISGYQRRNRKSTTIIPVEGSDQAAADQYSKVISSIHRNVGTLEVISDAFRDSLISGISLLHLWIDFDEDPISGDIKIDNVPANAFLIDPFFKKRDFSDCSAIWKRTYLQAAQVKDLLPEYSKDIDKIATLESNGLDKVTFGYMPENFTATSELLSYDEYFYQTTRKDKVFIDMNTGESLNVDSSRMSDEDIAQFLSIYPNVKVINKNRKTINTSILVNGKLIYDGANQLGVDYYPFVPVLGYFQPSLPSMSLRIQGVVRGLRDAQFLYNRRKAIEDDIVSSQVTSGWVYKENALVDPSDVFLSGQGKGIALKATAQMTDVQQIQPPNVPQSLFQLSQQYNEEIMAISGVNEELLGAAQDDKAGVLSMLRQGAGLTTLQTLFDNLDYSQKLLGKLELYAIQANYTPNKIARIIEEEPAPQFYKKEFGKYDAAVEEGFNTTTQKQTEFAQLLHLREIGVPVPDEVIIEAATIQNKNKLVETIKALNEAQQQQQQYQMQVETDLRQAQTNLANAKVESDLSLAKERDSRVFSNVGLMEERELQGQSDRIKSLLDLVKAMQEIDDATIGQLQKVIALAKITDAANLGESRKTEIIGSSIVKGATKDVPYSPSPTITDKQNEKERVDAQIELNKANGNNINNNGVV